MLCTWALRFLYGWNTLIERTRNLGTCIKYICEFRSTGIPTFVFLLVLCDYIWNIKYLFVLLVGFLLCCNPDSSMDLLYLFSTETGKTVSTAISSLWEHGVRVEKIILVTLFATPQGEVPKWHIQRSITINRWNI